MKPIIKFIFLSFAICLAALPLQASDYIETPQLEEQVKAGDLPPVAERLPETPRVIEMAARGREPGKHGGSVRMLMGKQKDIRMMVIYGYARFVGFDEKLELKPDILESFSVEEGRIFTFTLRKGHKWSDGHPFTTADIAYVWENVLTDPDLGKHGLPPAMKIDNKGPKFEVLDDRTVRFTWHAPNPDFLPALAAPRPLFLAQPAHYMRQFHKKFQDADKLEQMVAELKQKNWRGMHFNMGRQYRPRNPDLPTLDPWVNTVAPPAQRFVFRRNPYYHRVDENGRQLPYIDEVVLSMGSTALIPAKLGGGEADLQARYVRFDNYTFLKQAEKTKDIQVYLWKTAVGSQLALIPNLSVKDPVWRDVVRDVRFRRALSMAIDREDLNDAVYYGLATPSSDTMLEASPLFKEEYRSAWTQYDTDHANRLLDEMGLDKRNDDGIRLLSNGNPVEIIIETAGESTEQTDILELIGDYFEGIGVRIFARPSQRDIMRRRVASGEAIMSVWTGLDNAVATADMTPRALAPSTEGQLQWPAWGQWVQSEGASGEKPALPEALELMRLAQEWRNTIDAGKRAEIWHRILHLYTDNVFTIGTVNATRQPVVIHKRLRNVPSDAVYGFAPLAFFGAYMMDSFWYADE